MTLIARHIRVNGVVQGVGFRPFVWRLAQELGLAGWVRNDAHGVEIKAQGQPDAIAALLQRLHTQAPALARVDEVQALDIVPDDVCGFTIAESVIANTSEPTTAPTSTAIGPDVATCPDCLAELFNLSDRRWRHGFITCTHCGPRYTVTRALPYDRAQTSLAPFTLCTTCANEYTSPADRRFHAETTCCPVCGPRLSLTDAHGKAMEGDPIAACLRLLQDGRIVAIKGLGGFHLACDARNAEAVGQLRLRKNREEKPLAVMFANTASVLPYAPASATERALLESRERPIVLLSAHADCDTALPGVAPGLRQLGAMLPVTPLHYLLFHEAAGRPAGCDWLAQPQALVLVMTSANPGGEPIVRDTREAQQRLAGIADAVLDHNRDVVARCDDSVVRSLGAGVQFVRRSRGYAPVALRLPRSGPAVLSFGAYLKNCVCITRGDEAFLSPHIGDLNNAAGCDFLDETVQRMLHLLEVQPQMVAHDLHPDYFSTHAATQFAQRHGIPCVAVQHHHAHIAAVCAEHGWCDSVQGPVLGLALDGVGLGSDGAAWGGELLRLEGAKFQRLGHLQPLCLPGGDRAAREPWRMAASVLHALGRNAEIGTLLNEAGAQTVAAMLARGLHCPPSSSMGRVFDAAAGLLGLCRNSKFEAQAAVLLEQAATCYIEIHGWPQPMAQGWRITGDGQLDLLPVLATLQGSADVAQAAAIFHATLVAALAQWVLHFVQTSGLYTLAWAGGCFFNALLSTRLRQTLEQSGVRVLSPVRLSPGDGSIALGQAWVALNSMEQ